MSKSDSCNSSRTISLAT